MNSLNHEIEAQNETQTEGEDAVLAKAGDRNKLHAAFITLQDRIATVDREDPVATGVDTLTAARTIFGALPEIMTHRAAAARLPDFDTRAFDELETATKAAMFTQYEYEMLSRPPEPIHDLLEKGRKLLDTLIVGARALVHRGLLDAGFEAELSRGSGHAQLSSDVSRMARLFEREWPKLQNKTAITEAEWQEALELGEQLFLAVATREKQSNAREEMGVLRQQAKVNMILGYDAVRRGIEYLRWNQGDAAKIVPSLFAGRTTRKPKEQDVVDDTLPAGPPPIVVPVTPVAPVSPVTPITPAKGAAAPTQDDPFTT